MQAFNTTEPLTEAELDHLDEFLESCEGGQAMNIEELDGFFAALIAGPVVVLPSEYLPEVFGMPLEDCDIFETPEETDAILDLMMRHWNHISDTLRNDDIYFPLLLPGADGLPQGNDWAQGFVRGTMFGHDGWARLLMDEQQGGCMLPMLMLYHEYDEDPEIRPETPITPERRQNVIDLMTAGLLAAYRHFSDARASSASGFQPASRKIGRNDPCPCGSGKKYKRCCMSSNKSQGTSTSGGFLQ